MAKNIETQIVIKASKEEVWSVLTNFEEYKHWNPFIVQSTGKAVAGTRITNTLKSGGKTHTFTPVLLTVEPCSYVEWLGSLGVQGIFDGRHYFQIEEREDGYVQLTHGEHFSGILSGLVLRFIGDETRNNFVQMNNALKQRVETLRQEEGVA